MDLEQAIRSRRTHKAFGAEPVPPAVLDELFDLARWAPNHHLTNPWRFRVIGPRSRERLKAAAEADKPGSAGKLDRAPTLVLATVVLTGDEHQDRDDISAASVAAYLVLLGAHARGLAGYWRTIALLDAPAGRAALGTPDGERAVGLLHLGRPRQEQRVPDRAPVDAIATYLD
jgi:nitroreductase